MKRSPFNVGGGVSRTSDGAAGKPFPTFHLLFFSSRPQPTLVPLPAPSPPHSKSTGQRIWFVYVNWYQPACDNPEINCRLPSFNYLIEASLLGGETPGRKKLFQLGEPPTPNHPSSASCLAPLCDCESVCVCKLFANLSNFTLVKFPCKSQHFRRKPSGWVNVIRDCAHLSRSVRVWVCARAHSSGFISVFSFLFLFFRTWSLYSLPVKWNDVKCPPYH